MVRRDRLADIGVALLGAALGVSQVIHGAYYESTWGPIAVGALALVLALAVGIPRRLPLLALAPLIGLWLWSLVSSGWSDSHDAAHIGANRWLLYAATLAILCWVIAEDRRRASYLLSGVGVGVLGVAIWMLGRMLAGHGPALFLGQRLNDPLGYVNGQAGYLLVAVWPCLALAERRRRTEAALAGAGLAAVVVLVGLGLLTQSRSWGIAVVATALLLLVAIPGRRRRAAAMLLVGVTMALLYTTLADVWRHTNAVTGAPTRTTTHHAAVVIVIAALATGAVWGLCAWLLDRVAPTGSRTRTHAVRAATATLAALLVLALVAIGIKGGTITHRIHSQYEAFVHLQQSPGGKGGTRFFSGGGDRYDYWRVALLEFRSEPIRGVGAGNYQPGYYLHRRTAEEIQQPHSLELQTLAELGVVGGLLLLIFLAAVAAGFVRTARAAVGEAVARSTAVAAGGAFVAWLVQTSFDWLHLIPGLTAIALAAAAALLARPGARVLSGRARIVAAVVAVAVAAAGVITIAPRVLALHAQSSAEQALASRQPRAAIKDATRALDYDPNSVQALVLRAAGFARLDAFAPTLADIEHAIALEPHNWVTWGLLGDLLIRRGDRAGAHAAYRHALALNPLEGGLKSAVTTSKP